jgi:hypothetical protein
MPQTTIRPVPRVNGRHGVRAASEARLAPTTWRRDGELPGLFEPGRAPNDWPARPLTPRMPDQAVLRSFATPEQAVEFGAHLARKAGRLALHDFFLDVVRADIEAAVRASTKKGTGWWSKVEEVRLDIRGDDLAPKSCRLVVVTSSVLAPDEHDRWIQLGATFKRRARGQGIKVATTVVTPIDEMGARVYRETVELDIPSLRR